jgi:hypothetical protein
MSNLKQNTFKYLSDVSYFHDKRISTIQTDVVSWLLDKAENFVSEIEQAKRLPDVMVAHFAEGECALHEAGVKRYEKMIADRRQAEVDNANSKIAAKIARAE